MFSGSIPALATPFRDGMVDTQAYRRLIDWQIAMGSSALVAGGTTGESATLSFDEHYQLIETCIAASAGRVLVIAGCGSNDTATAVRHIRYATQAGADAALVVAPYYNRPSQAGILAHFHALAEASSLPIVVYNVPSRTGCDIVPKTMRQLMAIPSVVAIKDASGDLARVMLHDLAPSLDMSFGDMSSGPDISKGGADSMPPRDYPDSGGSEDNVGRFCQLSGNDDLWLAHAAMGGVGCISVTANVAPKLCADFATALAAEDWTGARILHRRLFPLHRAMFADASPAPTKYALARLHDWFPAETRLPISPPSLPAQAMVDIALRHVGLLSPDLHD